MLNAQKLQGSWNQIRGQVKEHWGNLTDDDLKLSEGGVDKLVGRIQQKTGEARDAIETYLLQLTEGGGSMVSKVAEAVGNASHQASDRMREHFQQVADQAGQGYDQARQLVRRNPAESLAVVFGVGLGFGLLIGLSLRSR